MTRNIKIILPMPIFTNSLHYFTIFLFPFEAIFIFHKNICLHWNLCYVHHLFGDILYLFIGGIVYVNSNLHHVFSNSPKLYRILMSCRERLLTFLPLLTLSPFIWKVSDTKNIDYT